MVCLAQPRMRLGQPVRRFDYFELLSGRGVHNLFYPPGVDGLARRSETIQLA